MENSDILHDLGEITFHNTQDLHRAYMPYISQGGIFVECRKVIHLGERAKIKITIEEGEACHMYEFTGKVVWITPVGAQNGLKPGVGLALSSSEAEVKTKIEAMLAGMINSSHKTLTM